MIELRLFGPPRLSGTAPRSAEKLARQPKRLALLAYLAAATPRGLHRRDTLLGLFWPDADDTRARGALSQSLYVLRNALAEPDLIAGGPSEVGLSPGRLWCDAVDLEEALACGNPAGALEVYAGDFMQGFFLSGAHPFVQWMERERARLRTRVTSTARELAIAEAEAGRPLDAARLARRAGELAGPDESLTRWLMTFLYDLGDRAGALRWYEAFAAYLLRDYDLEPSGETQQLAASMRDSAPAARAPARMIVVTPRERPSVPEPPRTSNAPNAPTVTTQPRGNTAPTHSLRRRSVPWRVAGALGVAASAALLWLGRRGEAPAPVTRFSIEMDAGPPMASGVPGPTIALSPDGTRLVYLAGGHPRRLLVRAMDQLEAWPLEHTEEATVPFFSPDGAWVGFVADGALRRVPLDGGPAIVIAPVSDVVSGASWGEDDTILFTTGQGLWSVAAAGGSARLVAAPPGSGEVYSAPEHLPNGRTALLTVADSAAFHLATVSLGTGAVARLGVEGTDAIYVPPERIVFGRADGVVLAAGFDPDAARIEGHPVPIVEDAFVGIAGALKLDLSDTGALAYVPNRVHESLVLVDRTGVARPLMEGELSFGIPRASPDGRQVIVSIRPKGGAPNLWSIDLDTGARRQLTFDGGGTGPAIWTPDGGSIAFRTRPAGRLYGYAIRRVAFGRLTSVETLVEPEPGIVPVAFTSDGTKLVYERRDVVRGFEILVLPLRGGSAARLLSAPYPNRAGALSPDERHVAYVTDVSGRDEVYAADFPEAGVPVQISTEGGHSPRWSVDGRELFYRTEAGLVAARLDPGTARVTGRTLLFDDEEYVSGTEHAAYDVLADGRFVMVRREATQPPVTVVLNALAGLER